MADSILRIAFTEARICVTICSLQDEECLAEHKCHPPHALTPAHVNADGALSSNSLQLLSGSMACPQFGSSLSSTSPFHSMKSLACTTAPTASLHSTGALNR
eukprot:1666886-Rhodomonas_salina.3